MPARATLWPKPLRKTQNAWLTCAHSRTTPADIVVEATDADETTPYEPYYNYDEPLRKIPNHRVLAIDRGEREGKLRVRVNVDASAATARLGARWPRRCGVFAPVFDAAIADGYKRLMAPSLEREARAKLTVRAQTEAINVFAKNLEGLLSARPVRGARVLALDPGYRTGCKIAVMDETGKLLDHSVVYPTKPRGDVAGTKRELARLVKKDRVNTIVIGNGTASRETEEVVSEFIAEQAPDLRYTIVNEAGASVYSASGTRQPGIPRPRRDRARCDEPWPPPARPVGRARKNSATIDWRGPVPARS